jgi:hypothetical protein
VEEHGPLAGMGALECGDDRIALADPLELLAIVIERNDPGHLRDRDRSVGAVHRLDLDVDWTV